jgi:hypothetical protein
LELNGRGEDWKIGGEGREEGGGRKCGEGREGMEMEMDIKKTKHEVVDTYKDGTSGSLILSIHPSPSFTLETKPGLDFAFEYILSNLYLFEFKTDVRINPSYPMSACKIKRLCECERGVEIGLRNRVLTWYTRLST